MGMKTSFTKNPTNPMTIRPTAVRRQICWYSARPGAYEAHRCVSLPPLADTGPPQRNAARVEERWGAEEPTRPPGCRPCPARPSCVLHRLAGGGRGVLEGYKSLKEDPANQQKARDAFLVVLGKEMIPPASPPAPAPPSAVVPSRLR